MSAFTCVGNHTLPLQFVTNNWIFLHTIFIDYLACILLLDVLISS